jgi:hypothetical protein
METAAAIVTHSSSIVLSDATKQHLAVRYSSPAADILQSQTFQGLDATKVDKAPQRATKGQSGTATGLSPIGDPQQLR